jgi:hypothetical protein
MAVANILAYCGAVTIMAEIFKSELQVNTTIDFLFFLYKQPSLVVGLRQYHLNQMKKKI